MCLEMATTLIRMGTGSDGEPAAPDTPPRQPPQHAAADRPPAPADAAEDEAARTQQVAGPAHMCQAQTRMLLRVILLTCSTLQMLHVCV
jgi:hypothetical protein